MFNPDSKVAVILVVDDDALININAVDMLEQLGHKALEAYSGYRLFRAAQRHIVRSSPIDQALPAVRLGRPPRRPAQ